MNDANLENNKNMDAVPQTKHLNLLSHYIILYRYLSLLFYLIHDTLHQVTVI